MIKRALLACIFVLLATGVAWAAFSFGSATTYSVGVNPRCVAIGDFGTGKLSAVCTNNTDNNISVLLGDGAGALGAKTNTALPSAATAPLGIAVGDLRGNGILDIVVTSFANNLVSVFLGNGNGTFNSGTNYNVDVGPTGVALGGLNGDVLPDIVTGNNVGNSVSTLYNNGSGGFTAGGNYSTLGGGLGTGPAHVALADFDGDGKLDVAVACQTGAKMAIMKGTGGSGSSFGAATLYTTGTLPYSICVGSLRNNGKIDVLVGNLTSKTISVYLGNGDATFAAKADYATGDQPYVVCVGDLDGDGILDVAAACYSTVVSLFKGVGDGTLAAKQDLTVNSPIGIALGDMNSDGKLDLVVCDYTNATLSVVLQTATGLRAENQGLGGSLLPFYRNASTVKGEIRNGSVVKGE